jgi:hypothetical protein
MSSSESKKSPPTERILLMEIKFFFAFLFNEWRITAEMVGAHFVSLARDNGFYSGLSGPEISRILNGKLEGKEHKLKDRLIHIFNEDFFTSPNRANSRKFRERVDMIKNGLPKDLLAKFIFKIDKANLRLFEGIYVGVVIDPKANNPSVPFVCCIRRNGEVEIASLNDYYRRGYLLSWGTTTYMLVDSKDLDYKEPELYLTKVPENISKDSVIKVSQFAIAGVWMNRDKRPILGTSLLIRQKFDETSILSGKEDRQKIISDFNSIDDTFIKRVQDHPLFVRFVEQSKKSGRIKSMYVNMDNLFKIEKFSEDKAY